MQFQPDLSQSDIIKAFVSAMARNIYFERTGTDDTYPGLSTYTYRIEA